jgi:hypothetical protein
MRRLDTIDPSQLAPVPTKAEGDGPESVTSTDNVLAAGDAIALVAIDDLHTATLRRRRTPAQRSGYHQNAE